MYVAPDVLLNQPMGWLTSDLPFTKDCIEKTYESHVCVTHPEVSSPCECGEPYKKMTQKLYPQVSFDPFDLKINHSGRMVAASIMVSTIILAIALSESISVDGVFESFNSFDT
jgi:hypothetical protein